MDDLNRTSRPFSFNSLKKCNSFQKCSHVTGHFTLDRARLDLVRWLMFVTTVPNRGSLPAVLLRESYREDGKVKSRTLANLSAWPDEKVETLRAALRGDRLVPAGEGGFEIRRSLPHGHVLAALATARRIGLDGLLPRRAPQPRHRAHARPRHRQPFPWRDVRPRHCPGARDLRSPRLAGLGTNLHREHAGPPPSEGRHAGTLRCHFHIS